MNNDEHTAGTDFFGDQDMSFDLPHKSEDDKLYEEVFGGIHEFVVEDPTVVAVLRKMEARSAAGMLKYATTMAANPLGLKEWLQHSIEEKMDDLLYMQRALEEIEKNETSKK